MFACGHDVPDLRMGKKRDEAVPEVTVLTPALNYGRFLPDNLASVGNQSGVSIQHVVQDARSSDETVRILEASSVDWRSEEDSGQSDALNRALLRARGKYVAWLNADEFYLPFGISILRDTLLETGADVVFADPAFVDETGRFVRIVPQHPFSRLLLKWYGCFIASCTTMFRREVLETAGWDTSFRLAMDWDLYLRLAETGARFTYVSRPVAAFRLHSSQVIAQPSSKHADEFVELARRHGVRGERTRFLGRWPHDVFKLVSGSYQPQMRARLLRGRDLRWFASDEGMRTSVHLIEESYRDRDLGRRLRAASVSSVNRDTAVGDGSIPDVPLSVGRRIYERVVDRLPKRAAAYADHLNPFLRSSWGGPLNGQARRQEMMRELVSLFSPHVILETGTYRGTSTDFLRGISDANIHTVEHDERFFRYSQLRFRKDPRVRVVHGDSRDYLERMSRTSSFPKERVLFYLDAHWDDDLPLWEELTCIQRTWTSSVIVVDDFQVPNDEGYGYDDWGEGKLLTEGLLPADALSHYTILYPLAPSSQETGLRRGCAVFMSPDLDELVSRLTTLRSLGEDSRQRPS